MAPPHRICSDKIIRHGDIVFIDIGANWNGYFGDVARTAICGEASKEQKKIHQKERRLTIRLHPEVALYLLEQEPNFLKEARQTTGIDLEVRDDPLSALDEFKLVAQPAGRDVTERYLVA